MKSSTEAFTNKMQKMNMKLFATKKKMIRSEIGNEHFCEMWARATKEKTRWTQINNKIHRFINKQQ